jgi:hypothetical protein
MAAHHRSAAEDGHGCYSGTNLPDLRLKINCRTRTRAIVGSATISTCGAR